MIPNLLCWKDEYYISLSAPSTPEGEILVTSTTVRDEPQYIRYLDTSVPEHSGVVARVFDLNGTPQGEQVNVGSVTDNRQNEVEATPLHDSTIVVSWIDESGFLTGPDVDDLRSF